MRNFLKKIYAKAVDLNHQNILALLESDKQANFLDLGCDDGVLTIQLAERIGTPNISGVEIVPERILKAEAHGVRVKNFDLNGRFDFEDDIFDVLHANQVIEHLHDSDSFLSEVHRILKPGGYAIISTENASSWCNIFAAIMGWQIFSLTNFSGKKLGIGNPVSFYRGEGATLASWQHVRIYSIRGLKEYFEVFGFNVEKIKGAGYFPLPAVLGNIDRTHCHFMAFKVRK